MANERQYPRKADISLTERLKWVATFTRRGWSAKRIADALDYDPRTAANDIAAVRNRTTEITDFDAHLKNLTARTQDQLTELAELKAQAWKNYDWAAEWVVQRDSFGQPMRKIDLATGTPGTDFEFGPRKPHMMAQIANQIAALNKQESDLLGLLDKSVDVKVKLEQAIIVQNILVNVIQNIKDPTLYGEVRRQVAAAKAMMVDDNQKALPPPDALEATFVEVAEREHA